MTEIEKIQKKQMMDNKVCFFKLSFCYFCCSSVIFCYFVCKERGIPGYI